MVIDPNAIYVYVFIGLTHTHIYTYLSHRSCIYVNKIFLGEKRCSVGCSKDLCRCGKASEAFIRPERRREAASGLTARFLDKPGVAAGE